MKAMIFDSERNLVWKEISDPVRKADEVLIEVYAAAVNRADLMQADGVYASPPGWPDFCGLEVAGVVLEAPVTAEVKPGDRVCALLGGGGYAQKVTAPAGMVIPAPEKLSLVEAATLPEVWSTAYLNLQIEAGGMKPGDVFFMQAGASGVGLAAIQMAKRMGAEVITTIDAPEKADFVRKLGAEYVIDYRKEPLEPVIAAHPPAVALDCVGGKGMGDCLRHMVFGGRWVMIATLAGGMTQIDLEVIWRKRIKLIGSTLRSRTSAEKTEILRALQRDLWPDFSARKLISNIHAVFPIEQAKEAHDVLRRCENIGKVVLEVKKEA
ncbi:MAG: NAD(P)H-quinone oxidoreductase [Victivallales bacterium]|jgi:NADPH2:quinone reductase|nr:NAD(P)H-quinone oxidoreductase [Victivallales bacterium]